MFMRTCTYTQVVYTDGEVEDVTLSALDSLLRSEAWRLQVLVAQGYIPSSTKMDGHYTHVAKVRGNKQKREGGCRNVQNYTFIE
jgi:hypothetical protein